MAEIDLPGELSDQDRRARAVFEIHLQPGETLIWADRANPERLASYYFGRPLLYGSILSVAVIVFFVVGISDGFARSLNLPLMLIIVAAALFMGSLMFVWEAVLRQAWRGIDLDEHYYALTDRRLLRSIGGRRPRAYKFEKIVNLNVEGPQDEEAIGDIQFYRDTGSDHQTYFRFHGIRRARKVAPVILKQLWPDG